MDPSRSSKSDRPLPQAPVYPRCIQCPEAPAPQPGASSFASRMPRSLWRSCCGSSELRRLTYHRHKHRLMVPSEATGGIKIGGGGVIVARLGRANAVEGWRPGPDEFCSRPPLQLTSGKHASKFSPTGFARAGVSYGRCLTNIPAPCSMC
jgi:hypothetical protein